MNLDGQTIWLFAAGDTNREYADVLLRGDVIAMGPGRFGPWPACGPTMKKEGHAGTGGRKLAALAKFGDKMQEGDLVVLRVGSRSIRGVGQIVGDYMWHDAFGDIDGWDLQHVRPVRWLWHGRHDFPDKYTLKYGDTVQYLDSYGQENVLVRSWLTDLVIPDHAQVRPIQCLPEDPHDQASHATMDQIADFLFDSGVASGSVKALVSEMQELVRIARWYETTHSTPSEHETVAYLVVPLLRALGWTPQKMGIEWQFVDVALFGAVPRKSEHLVGVVEAKKWRESCLSAFNQASTYAQKHGGERCQRLIVTDGMRYGVFLKKGYEIPFATTPDAYLNLTRLRSAYPSLKCQGAGEALRMMAADYQNYVPDSSPPTAGKSADLK